MRPVGNVTVQRLTDKGPQDVAYFIDFAFHAFHPEASIHE
jgi:hypothetical protein